MINSKDISVVVQGAISEEFTPTVLKSIRKYLPKAEIILSTWEGSNTEGFDYDILVENKDPGAVIMDDATGQKHNLNRQIVSTVNGLKSVKSKYALKLRTDTKLTGTGFLKYFDKFNVRNENCKIFEKRIVNCNLYARKANVFCFHPSDWSFFGLSRDVLNLFDIPLSKEPETSRWFYSHTLTKYHEGEFGHFRHKYCAEQYIWCECMKKHMDLNFENMFDFSLETITLSELSFANNFIILESQYYGIEFLKSKINLIFPTVYTFNEWQALYKKYCDNHYKIKFINAFSFVALLKYAFDIKFLLKYPRRYYLRLKSFKTNVMEELER